MGSLSSGVSGVLVLCQTVCYMNCNWNRNKREYYFIREFLHCTDTQFGHTLP